MPTYCNQKGWITAELSAWNLGQFLNLLQWSLDCLQVYLCLEFAHGLEFTSIFLYESKVISSEEGLLFSFYNKKIEIQSSYPNDKHYFRRTFNSINCFHIQKCIWLSNWETNPPNHLLSVAQNIHSEGTGRGLAPKAKKLTKT